jgi:hypothetical protein
MMKLLPVLGLLLDGLPMESLFGIHLLGCFWF